MTLNILDFGELSYSNRESIFSDTLCSCYYCRNKFLGGEIKEWIRKGENTALCPKCGIDSVIPFDVDDDTLKQAQQKWFM